MRRPLTPWHTLVDITVVTIHAAEGEYERFAKKETVGLTLSLANINAIISKVRLACIGFPLSEVVDHKYIQYEQFCLPRRD